MAPPPLRRDGHARGGGRAHAVVGVRARRWACVARAAVGTTTTAAVGVRGSRTSSSATMYSNKSIRVSGITPACSRLPIIVKVFPAPAAATARAHRSVGGRVCRERERAHVHTHGDGAESVRAPHVRARTALTAHALRAPRTRRRPQGWCQPTRAAMAAAGGRRAGGGRALGRALGRAVGGGGGWCGGARYTRAVRKAAGIVALQRLFDERLVGLLIDLRLRRRRSQREVEPVVLRLRLVEPQVVEAAHLIIGIVDLSRGGGGACAAAARESA